MSAARLHLEILTPDGDHLDETGVESVVFHRREARFERGSELAVLPGHAPMLVRVPDGPLRYRKGAATVRLTVAAGFVEVKRDRVLVLTPRFTTTAG